jgi:hypothetical protein
MLASETTVGLPSNIPPPPANLFGPATQPEPNPFLSNSPSFAPNPFEAPAPSTTPDPIPAANAGANPFEVAATIPAMSPMPPQTFGGDQPAPSTQRMPQSPASVPIDIFVNAGTPHDVMMLTADDTHDTHEETGAPSRQDLLQRAAALPPRMSFDSIVLQPTDPILINKLQPRVAERRARFRKVVKVALGACVAFCLVATAATALSSSGTPTSSPSSSTAKSTKTAPAAAVVPVEKLELAVVTKANNGQHPGVTAAARPAPSPALKKRR